MTQYKDLILTDGTEPNSYRVTEVEINTSHREDIRNRMDEFGKLTGEYFTQEDPVDGQYPFMYKSINLEIPNIPDCRVLGLIKEEKDIPDKTYTASLNCAKDMAKNLDLKFRDLTSRAEKLEEIVVK